LSLFSRAGTTREAVDLAVAELDIHELPSARGCTYVIPKCDFALALRLGQEFNEAGDINTARKHLGVTEDELARLYDRVLEVLAPGPLDPTELRTAAGEAVRNLGEAGKKRGMTNTLSLALGRLQSHGRIRRIPTNGRLDQQRYRYAIWDPSPLQGSRMTREDADTELARRYFQWTGPATLAEFRSMSGLGAKAARDAIAPLGLVSLPNAPDSLLFPEELEDLLTLRVPAEPRYALVGSIDSILLLRRNPASQLDPEDLSSELLLSSGGRAGGALQDLPSHAILDRGRIIGVWEFDPEKGAIVWVSLVEITSALRACVAATEAYIRDQLGDFRSFSLDSPQSRKPRIAAIRAAMPG
jgi:hypothetical protein